MSRGRNRSVSPAPRRLPRIGATPPVSLSQPQPHEHPLMTPSRRSMSPSRRGPPKPEEQDFGSPSKTPRSHRSNETRNEQSHGRAVPIDIYRDADDDSRLSDDMSDARSVASNTLGAILSRIEDAKAQLVQSHERGGDSQQELANQVEMASLIEKLASAAVAVKKLEDA
mmetsp:Transcript_5646/g.8680  ORF Transcript_5646/g.8680 Transcript_5646/m.8680 type:complete len:169 (+) Transcript_5646:133-639(+)